MTSQHPNKMTATKARGICILLRRFYRPKVESFAAESPPSTTPEFSIQTEIRTYQAIFASDLAGSHVGTTRYKADQAQRNSKNN